MTTTTNPTLETQAALIAAAMHADELFARYGWRAEIQIVSHGTFVVTVRTGNALHVVAGTARECLAKLENG